MLLLKSMLQLLDCVHLPPLLVVRSVFSWAAPSERVNVYLMSSVFICCCCFVIVGFEILKTLGQFDVWGSSVWWCIWLGVFFTISLWSTDLLLSVVSLFDILRRNIAAVALSRLLLLLRRSGEARWRANALNAFIARCSDNYAKVLSIHCISYIRFLLPLLLFSFTFFVFPSSIRLHSVPHPTSDSATLFYIKCLFEVLRQQGNNNVWYVVRSSSYTFWMLSIDVVLCCDELEDADDGDGGSRSMLMMPPLAALTNCELQLRKY